MNIIRVDKAIRAICPDLAIGLIEYEAAVIAHHSELWEKIEHECAVIMEKFKIEQLAELPEIADCRRFYKQCGKDPSRYRVSSEALIRRILRGKGLYKVNSIVDFNNLVSIRSLFSVCSYDTEQLSGDITFRIGQAGESFKGIRKEMINLEGLPVFSDDLGSFGSPTHDSERTMITEKSSHIMTKIMSFSGDQRLKPVMDVSAGILREILQISAMSINVITVKKNENQ